MPSTSGSFTGPYPVLAASVASSLAGYVGREQDRIIASFILTPGHTSVGYSGERPTVPTNPVASTSVHQASDGFTGALPNVPTTPKPSLGTVISGPPKTSAKAGKSTATYNDNA